MVEKSKSTWQRRAIASVRSMASWKFGNSARISASDFTYIWSVSMRMRFSSESVLPVWMHISTSWASASSRVR